MSVKRKRVVLSINKKLEIIDKLDGGARGSNLAREYGVGVSTISDIGKNKEKLLQFSHTLESNDGSKKRKTMKQAENNDLEIAMYTWFLQKRSQGQPISGPLVCEKAIQLNQQLGGDPEFKATTGWLQRFKSRHGIRELEIHGEKLSANPTAATDFRETFLGFISANGYNKSNIYNADETGLNWKALPTRSLVAKREMTAPGYKSNKQRVTIMTCANSTGSHRLPLLMIGKSKNPRCFKNLKKLPLNYRNQRNSWMDTALFTDWYDNIFIPEVKKHQAETGENGKVLLIVDNAPSHPPKESLERENGLFKVLYLPPNVTSIIQPMDQGVIEAFKKFYRKQLLRRLLMTDDNNAETLITIFKQTDLKDCAYMAADAWNLVAQTTLQRAWRKLFSIENEPQIETSDDTATEITEIIKTVPGLTDCDLENVKEWLTSDQEDPGYQILTDEEIVAQVTAQQEVSDEEDDRYDTQIAAETGPSAAEAFRCIEVAMKWLEKQEECDAMQLLQLKRLRDLAARKRTCNLKQKTILNFFK